MPIDAPTRQPAKKATPNPMGARKSPPAAQEPLPATSKSYQVEFRRVSRGKQSGSIGASFPRSAMEVQEADDLLTNSQLQTVLTCEELDEQETVVLDCAGFTARQDKVSCSFRFSLDGPDLYAFAGRTGTATFERLGPIPPKERKPRGRRSRR